MWKMEQISKCGSSAAIKHLQETGVITVVGYSFVDTKFIDPAIDLFNFEVNPTSLSNHLNKSENKKCITDMRQNCHQPWQIKIVPIDHSLVYILTLENNGQMFLAKVYKVFV